MDIFVKDVKVGEFVTIGEDEQYPNIQSYTEKDGMVLEMYHFAKQGKGRYKFFFTVTKDGNVEKIKTMAKEGRTTTF